MPQKQTQTQQASSVSQTSPWAPQIPYLTQAFQNASNIYNQNSGNLYNGQQVAQFSPDQLATFQRMVGYGGNTSIPNSSAATGSTLASAGTSGITGALDHLASFTPSGGTQSNIDAATQYANNPAIGGMVDAAMRDANRNATENVLPALSRNSAATGNLNSNRNAIQQGIVERGLNDQAGDISSQLRGQAYGTGLNLAEQNNEFNNNAMLNAFQSAGALGNSAAGTGVNANTAAIGQQGGLFDIANQGGTGQQASDQASIDNAKQMAEYGYQAPYDLLAREMGIISGNYGGTTTGNSTSTGTTTTTASPLSIAGGALGTLGSLFLPGAGGISAAGNLFNFAKGGVFK